jgi:hypothetical protein
MLPAEHTAALVIDAVKTGRFWILTHDGYNEWLTARAAGMLTGEPSARPPVF